eukprot:18822_1
MESGLRKFNVIIMGSAKSGKSSMMNRALGAEFVEKYIQTIGAELLVKEQGCGSEKYTLNIWCCGGHPRFRPLIDQFCSDVKGAILAYDMTDRNSFQEVSYWRDEMLRICPDCCLLMVGMKYDLTEHLQITGDDARKQAESWGLQNVVTSAKTGHHLNEVFDVLTKSMVDAERINN